MSSATAAELQRGVVVEFDYAVLPGHAIILEECRKCLEEQGLVFDRYTMAKYLDGNAFALGLKALCEKQEQEINVTATIAQCNSAINARLAEKLPEMPKSFYNFVKHMLAKGIKVVILTRLEHDFVAGSFESIACEDLIVMHDTTKCFGFSSWEVWQRNARNAGLFARLCVAVASSGYSVKGALEVGMNVIAKPNELTFYQDFTGTNEFVEDYTPNLIKDVKRLLHQDE